MQGNVVLVGANFRNWVSAVRHLYALLAVGVWTPAAAEADSPRVRLKPPSPQPPYLETTVSEYMVSLFETDRSVIESLLPPGLNPAPTNTVGVSHFVLGAADGPRVALAPYEATFIFAEIEGRDDPSGNKGRHVLWGLYSEDLEVAALADVLGLPMRVGTTAIRETEGEWIAAGNSGGEPMIVSGISPKGNGPITLGGVLHYPSLRYKSIPGDGVELDIQPISWTASVQIADLVSMKLNFPVGHPLERLEPRRLLYSYFGQDLNFEFGSTPRPRAH